MTGLAVRQHPSPNFGPRRDSLLPDLIVIHYTAMQNAEAALERLCDRRAEVSAHYLISRKGEIIQLVAEEQRAWHAGAGEWQGKGDVNSRSIGIELDNSGDHPFPEPQMEALEALLRGITARWDIAPEGVIGHSDLAPGRKIDPGPRFDWARLARQKLVAQPGHGQMPETCTQEAFREQAVVKGYTAPCDDETLLHAVRLRFRPWATGPLAPQDFLPLSGPKISPPEASDLKAG